MMAFGGVPASPPGGGIKHFLSEMGERSEIAFWFTSKTLRPEAQLDKWIHLAECDIYLAECDIFIILRRFVTRDAGALRLIGSNSAPHVGGYSPEGSESCAWLGGMPWRRLNARQKFDCCW